MDQGLQSPLGNFSDIANSYALSFGRQRGQTQAVADRASTANQVENQQVAIEKKVNELKSLTDPNAYKKVRKQDGGFDFFDPQGNQVDIATVADRTGTKAGDWVSDSENPIDIQYNNDYKNLQGFMDAVLSKDQAKIDQFTSTDPNLQQYISGRGGIDRLMQEFKKAYQRYYTPRSVDQQAWGQAPSRVVVPTPQSGGGYGLGTGGGIQTRSSGG